MFNCNKTKLKLDKFKHDKVIVNWLAEYEKETAELLNYEVLPEEKCMQGAGQHGSYFAEVLHLEKAVEHFGFMYHITGDNKYAETLKKIMLEYTKYEKWVGPGFINRFPVTWHSSLETAHFADAMAKGFDFIFGCFDKKEKTQIVDALIAKGIKPIHDDWVNHKTRIHSLDSMGHNWWVVCIAQMGLASILLKGESAQADYWIESAREALEEWMTYDGSLMFNKPGNLNIDGGFYEGVTTRDIHSRTCSSFLIFIKKSGPDTI
jgi:hypothetical protein